MEKEAHERFERLDATLERVGKRLDEGGQRLEDLDRRLDRLAARQDKFEAELEVQNHVWDERFSQLWKAHSALMDTQNTTWAAINQLTANIDRLMRRSGPNGHGE